MGGLGRDEGEGEPSVSPTTGHARICLSEAHGLFQLSVYRWRNPKVSEGNNLYGGVLRRA